MKNDLGQEFKDFVEAKAEASQKRVAYYQVIAEAWVKSRFEIDNALLRWSFVAIVILVLWSVGLESIFERVLWFVSLGYFFNVVLVSLAMYSENCKYIEKLLEKSADAARIDEALEKKTKSVKISFMCGWIALILLAMYQKAL